MSILVILRAGTSSGNGVEAESPAARFVIDIDALQQFDGFACQLHDLILSSMPGGFVGLFSQV